MKYTLADKDITILEHLVFVAEKSAKTIQFCFKKGKHQTYIAPKKDLLVSFDLQAPISFDYPIANLKTFLADDIKDLDPDKNNVDISQLVLATDKDEEGFNTKIIYELDFTHADLINNQKLKKYRHFNIIGQGPSQKEETGAKQSSNTLLYFQYQNHERSWWFDDNNRKQISKGKSTRKFRYVMKRDVLRLLPNDYNLILRKGVVQFQFKHLNYYFLPIVDWTGHSVKDWTHTFNLIDDKHLIKQYQKKNHFHLDPVGTPKPKVSKRGWVHMDGKWQDY